MNYEVHIEDMLHLEDELILHFAERGTIMTNWLGGDDKTKPLIPAECNFTLEVNDGADAAYEQYFTTDEKRFRVTQLISADQEDPEDAARAGEIIFRGYLLPESYTEPWENPLFYVAFSSVDGLGLLKGKELTPDFYSEEKTVIEVITACLQLTKIDFDIYYAPAIQNNLKKNWHEIITDTAHWYDDEKPPSAYDFLYAFIASLQCRLYQCEGRWYIEGINKMHLPKVKWWKYAITGEYLGTVEIEKDIRKLDWLASGPVINMVPGASKIVVTHANADLNLSQEVVQENNLKGIPAIGIDNSFLPKHWNYVNYFAKMEQPEYYLSLPIGFTVSVQEDKRIEIKRRPYVLKGTKVRIKMQFQIEGPKEVNYTDLIDDGVLVDMQPYRIKINDRVLYYNLNTAPRDPARLDFDTNGGVSKVLEFVVPENGYLNIELFQPIDRTGYVFIYHMVKVKELQIEELDASENVVYTLDLTEESSIVHEVELEVAEDYSQNSKCFYLERTRELTNGGPVVEVPILYARQQNGKNYSIVSMKGINAIEQYPDLVKHENATPVKVVAVHYNLNDGDEMAIETESYFQTGSFYVNMKPYKPLTISRLEWLNWTDSNYGIQKRSYARVVAEIRRNLFSVPHLRFTGEADAIVKFNTLIEFTYKKNKKYFLQTDLGLNSDEGSSSITMVEGIYSGESLGNVAPFVDAGPDIILEQDQTSAQITEAVVNDPDGTVSNLLWERLAGPSGETYSSASSLLPLISGLTGNNYTFRLTAIDNLGASGSDTMSMYRKTGYLLNSELTMSTIDRSGVSITKRTEYNMYITPDLADGEAVILKLKAIIEIITDDPMTNGGQSGGVLVLRNDVIVFRLGPAANTFSFTEKYYEAEGSISVTKSDKITLRFLFSIDKSEVATINASATFNSAEFRQNPTDEITNLPYEKTFTHNND